MRGHQVRHKELLFAKLLIEPVILPDKPLVDRFPRFAHLLQHRVRDVFRRHLELSADMMFHQFPEKGIVSVRQQIVEADPRTDKDLLYAGQRPQPAQQCQIIGVIHFQIRTGLRKKALSVLADPPRHLLLTGRSSEIGRRAAHIMNISFKIFILQHPFRFPQDRLVAPDLHRPSLVKSQGTEIAAAKASSVADKRKPYLRDGGHTAGRLVGWMTGAHIGQIIDIVHLLRCQRRLGRILHHTDAARICLDQRPARKRIGIAVLHLKALRIPARLGFHFFIRRQPDSFVDSRYVFCLINRSGNKGNVPHRDAPCKCIGDLHDGLFPHTIGNQIRLTVQQDGTFKAVRPVIIVRHTTQTGLDAADDHRHIFIYPADQIAINHGRVIRPFIRLAAWSIGVHGTVPAGHEIMVDHGIHIAAGYKKAKPGPAQYRDALLILPVRL